MKDMRQSTEAIVEGFIISCMNGMSMRMSMRYAVCGMRSLDYCYLHDSNLKFLSLSTWHECAGRCANTAPRQRFANKPCLLPLPDSCSRRRRAAPLIMITRILRSIPLAITALACLASTARAADEAKNDYGTVIGIGTRFLSLTALNSSSPHYPSCLQTWVPPTRPLGTIFPLRHPMSWPPADRSLPQRTARWTRRNFSQ